MTYEQYWCCDPLMVRAFYKSEKMRRDRSNSELWLAGIYVKKALESTVGNMFLKKGGQPNEYPQQPIGFDGEFETMESAKQEKQEEAQAKLYMYNMIRAGKEWGNH